ncbi:TPA: hypothetical protein QCY29_005232 [Bacillus toyonensis]|nr:hypothetical protein [Bacillus toyonensis]
MLNRKKFLRYHGTFKFDDPLRSIDKVKVEIVAQDAVVRNEINQDVPIHVSDLHFQPGNQLTGWIPETRELLRKIYHENDEFKNQVTTKDIYLGGAERQPVKRTNLEYRTYNIVGRGHEIITIPNYYPDNWYTEVLPTGIDFEIFPKDDYDLCRISTNHGSVIDPDLWHYKYILENNDYDSKAALYDYFGDPNKGQSSHPLHVRYTREFWVGAGKAHNPIRLFASNGSATRGGARLGIGGVNEIPLPDGRKFRITRNQLFLLPKGAIRFRIEFYKTKTISLSTGKNFTDFNVLADTGIGFYGTAKFNQWTYGGSRI